MYLISFEKRELCLQEHVSWVVVPVKLNTCFAFPHCRTQVSVILMWSTCLCMHSDSDHDPAHLMCAEFELIFAWNALLWSVPSCNAFWLNISSGYIFCPTIMFCIPSMDPRTPSWVTTHCHDLLYLRVASSERIPIFNEIHHNSGWIIPSNKVFWLGMDYPEWRSIPTQDTS